jgi:hypothetical protein
VISRVVAGRTYWALVGILTAAIVGVGSLLAVAVALPEVQAKLFPDVGVAVLPTPTATATPEARAPMAVPIPANADCNGCHGSGGAINVANVPVMAHPVQGWTDCTACHADDRLVKTAPGHSGIHKDLCLACHRPPEPGASALPRPHHVVPGTACTACHGAKAPLPTDMAGRQNCWLCHPGKSNEFLFGSDGAGPTPGPSPGSTSP